MPEQHPPLLRRLMWFAALWAGGVGTVAVVGLLIRGWLLN